MTRPAEARPPSPPPGRRPKPKSQTLRRLAPAEVVAAGTVALCEFCRGRIVWVRELDNPNARTPEGKVGKLVPIDPEPSTDPRANLALSAPSGAHSQHRVGEMKTASLAAAYRAAGKDTYIRHVKTCTHADDLRRGVRAKHSRGGR